MIITRCLLQPLRISVNRSSTKISFLRSNLINCKQLIKDRKFTTNQIRFNKYEDYTKATKGLEQLKKLENELSQLNLYNKFKKIVSEYYHVIIFVHLATSAIWFSLACLVKIQFELTPEPLLKVLENYNVPQFVLAPLKNKTLQLIAVPFFLYKSVTPLRYYTTIACSLPTIRYLMMKGMIQPRKTPKIIELMFGKVKKVNNK